MPSVLIFLISVLVDNLNIPIFTTCILATFLGFNNGGKKKKKFPKIVATLQPFWTFNNGGKKKKKLPK